MSSSSCVESSDEEKDNPYPFTNPHYIKNLKSTMQLVTISTAIKDHREVDTNTRTAAQIFLEDQLFKKAERRKAQLKLALLQQEVHLGRQLLEQKQTLMKSKQELQQLCQSRVKFVKPHKLWRGAVITTQRSAVAETVHAATMRLQQNKKKFDQVQMLAAIDKLAPESIYISKIPSQPATSRPCPARRYVPRRVESLATQTVIRPPTLFKEIERAAPQHWQSPVGYQGDQSIVSHHGDVIIQEPLYDTLTQLESDQHKAFSDEQGSCCEDVANSDVSLEEETISDISAEASDSLCYDTDGNVFGF